MFLILKLVSLHADINGILQRPPIASHFPQEITKCFYFNN